MNLFKVIPLAGVSLLVLTVVFGSFYTVDQGSRVVVLRNGAIASVEQPGLHFKIPLIDSVQRVSIKESVADYNGQDQKGLQSYSYDQQTAGIHITVNYSIPADKVSDVYAKFGGEVGLITTILDPKVYRATKEVFGQFTAQRAIQERQVLGNNILDNLQKQVANEPIVINSVQIMNIDFSDVFEQSIEKRMQAEVEVQKIKQDAIAAKVTAEITVTQAQSQADSQLAQATAEAKGIQLKGEAEATAIRAKGEALRDNPNLVDLIKAETWNGVLPTTMLPNSTIPFMDMNPIK